MSSMDPMKDGSWILSETMRKISLRPSRFHQLQNTKSSSLMRQITQPTMYNSSYELFIEEFSANCRFIFTCNYKNRLVDPLHSRCACIDFSTNSKDRPKLAAQFFSRIQEIMGAEGVEYDHKVLVELINKHFPDWRRVLNELQRYSSSGKIDSGILASFSDVKVNDLIKNLKKKEFSEVRKWVVNNLDNDSGVLMRRIYDVLHDSLVPNSIPAAVLILAKYQYQIAFVADQEINMLACLTEIMVECEFK